MDYQQSQSDKSDLEQKEQYIQQYIVDYGYKTQDYLKYLAKQKINGDKLESWSLNELAQSMHNYYGHVETFKNKNYVMANSEVSYESEEKPQNMLK